IERNESIRNDTTRYDERTISITEKDKIRWDGDFLKIRQLPERLANKIAAGEVVERPASVVKELIENSIDANSTIIKIELKEAGLSQIKVTDNGEGMSKDDCKRAFLRHATSKITFDADLFHIHS